MTSIYKDYEITQVIIIEKAIALPNHLLLINLTNGKNGFYITLIEVNDNPTKGSYLQCTSVMHDDIFDKIKNHFSNFKIEPLVLE